MTIYWTMTRFLYCFAALIFLVVAPSSLSAQYPDSLHLEELRTWLKESTYDGEHGDLGYDEARRQMYSYVDEVQGEVNCIYTDFTQSAAYVTFLNPINAEHLVPQSLFGSASPMRSDIHVIRPSHMDANSARSHFRFEEIEDTQAQWYGVDGQGNYWSTAFQPTTNDDFSEGDVDSFEPQEDRKGDVARQVFYFYTMYPTQAGSIDSVADPALLLSWHLADPVDALELQRNNRIEEVQGNRNPYIDHAELAYDAWLWEEDPCPAFMTAPVDLTKSLQPVPFPNGVIDRVQVKWYKDSPHVKFAPSDSAACDIQFWPVRDLDLNIPIQATDSSMIVDRTKPGQFFFKWPIKFQRSDVQPLVRYKWRVRCACEEGNGPESPWSEVKIFNTPDFDPNTGIFSPSLSQDETKNEVVKRAKLSLFPNPAQGYVSAKGVERTCNWSLINVVGTPVRTGIMNAKSWLDLSGLPSGLYFFYSECSVQPLRLVLE